VVKMWKSVSLKDGGGKDLEQAMRRVWDKTGAEAVDAERGGVGIANMRHEARFGVFRA
jgi:hypothetical protein